MMGWLMGRTGALGDVLRWTSLPDPSPRTGELLLDVEIAGLSFADMMLIRGEYQVTLPLPCVPGTEFIGIVRAAGSGTSTPVGARVLGLAQTPHGAYAELTVANETLCETIPKDLPGPEGVCLIGNYVTAHLALHRRARVQPGEVVVVHGAAGGVGTAAIQVAKAAGARVLAVDLGAERVHGCLAAGADAVVDASQVSAVAPAVRAISDGRGADVVIDMVGGALFEVARRVMAFEGRIVVVGFTGGAIPEVRVNQLLLRSFGVLGVNALTVATDYPLIHKHARAAVVALLVAGEIAPPVGAVRPFADLIDLSEDLRTQEISGKAVIQAVPARVPATASASTAP